MHKEDEAFEGPTNALMNLGGCCVLVRVCAIWLLSSEPQAINKYIAAHAAFIGTF